MQVFTAKDQDVGWGLVFDGRIGSVGIGNPDPSFPISFKDLSGDKISLYREGSNYYGLGVGNASMQLMTPHNTSDILFGYGRSATFTENMRIKGNGRVGIGTANPNAIIEAKSNITGIPILRLSGVNEAYQDFYPLGSNGGRYGWLGFSASEPDKFFLYNDRNGDMSFITGGGERLTLKNNGNVGIGVSDPSYKLDVVGRMRVRSTTGESAGLWLNNNANNSSPAFIGMQTDNKVGFYGTGNGWGLTMNTQSGSMNINGNAGTSGQVPSGNGDNQATSWTKLGNLLQTYYRYTTYSSNVATGDPLIKEFDGGAMAITTPGKSRLIISAMFIAYGSCGICTDPRYGKIKLNINGNPQEVSLVIVPPNGVQYITLSNYFYDVPGGNHSLKWELDLSNTFQPMSSAYISNVTVMVLPID